MNLSRSHNFRAFALAAIVASLVFLALGAGGASAHELETFEVTNTFNTNLQYGEAPGDLAVDEETGTVYAVDHGGNLYKYDENGHPSPFSDPELAGSNKLQPTPYNDTTSPGGKVVVDNSGTETQGRIYLLDGNFNIVHLYKPSGEEITTGKWPLSVEDIVPSQFNPGNMDVDTEGHLWDEEEAGFSFVREFDKEGNNPYVRMGNSGQSFALDSENNEYIGSEYGYYGNGVGKYTTDGKFLFMLPPSQAVTADVSTDELYALQPTYGERYYVNQYLPNGTRVAHINAANGKLLQALTYNHTNGTMYVGYYGQVNILKHGPTVTIPDVTTDSPSKFEPSSVELHGTLNPDGTTTTACEFVWGPNAFNLTHSAPCDQGHVHEGSEPESVSATLLGLTFGETYYYQLRVQNPHGEELGREVKFVTSEAPSSEKTFISEVHSDSATVHTTLLPGGAETSVHVEYGPEPCSTSACSDSEHVSVPAGTDPKKVAVKLGGLKDGTTFYYRLVADNQSGTYTGPDKFFTTFPYEAVDDKCENAHVRQQTGAARLLDCRAYELASAANASGYDVESDLATGQEPLSGYPEAEGRALYAVHDGAISGTGAPANRGPDPYLATRGPQEWTTEYVGIPSDNEYASESFASTLLEADPALDAFAFGGPEICAPCFEDGSTNLPLRLANKELVPGMAGSESSEPAEPSGYIGRSFSADGKHLVFGTTAKLEPAANEGGADTTIYERDLETDQTQVVSTLPDESTMADGPEVGELGISADGSRVVVGELVSTDSAGNNYWHLYMHVGSSPETIDLTPGASDGVLYDGMTADGSKVYFTTRDALSTPTNQDTDTSADIYLAEVGSGSSTLSRVSYGSGAGNSDSCEPPAGWNSVEGGNNCDVVAIAGGGGVASESGTIYFVSPEKLDTSGPGQPVQDQANLYEARPGSAPHFVATVDSSIGKPAPAPPKHKEANPEFATTPSAVWMSMTVDQQTGDLYALDGETGIVHRWKPNGEADDFSSTGNNELHVGETYTSAEYQISVDSSSGPYSGYLYFATNTEEVKAFNPAGEEMGALSELGEACGVSVDASGDVYVGTYGETVSRFVPKSSAGPTVSNASYEPKTGMTAPGMSLCNLSAGSDGHVYIWPYEGGEVTQYEVSEFTNKFPILGGKQIGPGFAVQTDPKSGIVYILGHEGEVITAYNSEGKLLEELTAEEMYFAHSLALDVENGRVYSGMYERIIEFDAEETAYEPIDNPLVRDGVLHSGVHSYKDFQVTPSGRYAAFATTQKLNPTYDNEFHYEVYRYDGQENALACVSCNPSNAVAEGDAGLAPKGLSLTDDGAVFFNTTDAIVARDLDSKQDAYEYESGELQLISTGVSPFASSLSSVTANGKDAFFFTRDTLVPQDENGSLVKLYDAREGGGYPYVPPEVPCKASDECHGPGTEAPQSPDIKTFHGNTGNVEEKGASSKPHCKKGQVRKHGKCVKKHKSKRHKSKRRHARSGHHRNG